MVHVIGLTGLIGTGKSTVARLLERQGIPVHDADRCVQALYEDKIVQRALLQHFPLARSWRTFKLDKNKLMSILKRSPKRREWLNAFIHPLVEADQAAFLKRHRAVRVIVLDVPLLFEAGMDRLCDEIWVTTCSPALQKARVLRRPGFTEEKFETIKYWQGDDAWKKNAANLVINTGMNKARLAQKLQKALRS